MLLSLSIPHAQLPEAERLARRRLLVQLGLAWLVMMQVMMLAFPAYLRHDGMEPEGLAVLDWAIFLMNWASLVLTAPVIVYCALPIWQGAWASLRRGRIAMDVPVALSIVASFVPSVHATFVGRGEVYFESVSMFVAFLLTARYLALRAQQTSRLLGEGGWKDAERARMGARADHVATLFVAVQVLAALAVGALWWHLDPAHALPVTVSLLVMSCPCALAISVPTALAVGDAARLRAGLPVSQADGYFAAVRRVAAQNVYGSLAWHVLAFPIAAMGWVTPWLAALAMLLSSLAVAANAWRLSRHPALASPVPALAVLRAGSSA
ncbi:Type cbb3 cytochrome oxidase biogenesis protein CcoI; Copper-translocating P-type ATPase [plant metagenome]|uniref:Type cbb3 cytochrome oxidase biogenesis protein CcoI Copper-translocating P-type ATPase n=1 Tax=plant metagenome TaxID=1297885 RepID=A0A484TN05_9ZZZZ